MARRPRKSGRQGKRLAIFNHKGGVGKTTLTVNIAAALASRGKRVLLVDSDPQCNLTSYLFDDEVVDDLLDGSDKKNGRTVWTALKPVVEATGDINLIQPFELSGDNQYLLPGDIRLSEFEAELNDLWAQCLQRRTRGFRGTSSLSSLIDAVVQECEIDFVFYDSGPNIGPLNRVVLLDCDFFVVPVACDLFSLRALRTLGRTLSSWISEWRLIAQLAPEDAPLLPGQPKFLGYVPQHFRVYGGEVSKNHAEYLRQIDQDIRSQVVNVLKDVDPSLSLPLTGSKLGAVRDFGTIVTTSQREGVPIADVSAAPAALGPEARRAFASIARKIIDRAEG